MTEHNLGFYQALMKALREAISKGELGDFADRFRRRYASGGQAPALQPAGA